MHQEAVSVTTKREKERKQTPGLASHFFLPLIPNKRYSTFSTFSLFPAERRGSSWRRFWRRSSSRMFTIPSTGQKYKSLLDTLATISMCVRTYTHNTYKYTSRRHSLDGSLVSLFSLKVSSFRAVKPKKKDLSSLKPYHASNTIVLKEGVSNFCYLALGISVQ